MADSSEKEIDVVPMELGFVDDDYDSWKLTSKFFPSKVGGKPAWLHPAMLPTVESLLCDKCKKPVYFLMQVYCPIESKESCYHRSIFLFACKTPSCSVLNSAANFKAFRCQLPVMNEFYPDVPPDENCSEIEEWKWAKLCAICGCAGPKQCAKCHGPSYCSRDHQAIHWKQEHKYKCGNDIANDDYQWQGNRLSSTLFPEYELLTEIDESSETDDDEQAPELEKTEEEKLAEYEAFVQSGNVTHDDGLDTTELEAMANTEQDEQFSRFKRVIAKEPEQVLRYQRGGQPLWASASSVPAQDSIPDCENCGSKRIFEFQIMPQLLNFLNVDSVSSKSLDWATVALYACRESCDNQAAPYQPEFVWKQDYELGQILNAD